MQVTYKNQLLKESKNLFNRNNNDEVFCDILPNKIRLFNNERNESDLIEEQIYVNNQPLTDLFNLLKSFGLTIDFNLEKPYEIEFANYFIYIYQFNIRDGIPYYILSIERTKHK